MNVSMRLTFQSRLVMTPYIRVFICSLSTSHVSIQHHRWTFSPVFQKCNWAIARCILYCKIEHFKIQKTAVTQTESSQGNTTEVFKMNRFVKRFTDRFNRHQSINPFPPNNSWCWSVCPLLTSSLSLDRLHVYISSACPDLVGSWLPFIPTVDCRSSSSGSICLATSGELFSNWFSSWVLFSRFSTGSGRMAEPSGGADWMYSEGNDEESDWTARLSPSFTTSCEEVGSVRMFLEITEATEECLDFETWNLQPQNKQPKSRHEVTGRCQLAGRWRNEPPVGL